MDGTLAQIIMFAGNFSPRGWLFCHGQLLSIAQNTAVFALLGTTYGGNGQTTFGVPDLRGRVPVGAGQGPGLSNVQLGESAGVANQTLLVTNMPAHNHTLNAFSEAGDSGAPQGNRLANSGATDREYRTTGTGVAMGATAIGNAGGSQPFSIMQPYLGMNYVICQFGIFPSRN